MSKSNNAHMPELDDVQANLNKSFFARSALHNVISTSIDFEAVVSVFRKESAKALSLGHTQTSIYDALRREEYKTLILKILIYIGVSCNGNGMAVIARIIEILALDPAMSPDQAIDLFAITHSASFGAVERIVEKHLNVYNQQLFTRVTDLTRSQPMTSKDILCDLSVFVRINFMQEIKL